MTDEEFADIRAKFAAAGEAMDRLTDRAEIGEIAPCDARDIAAMATALGSIAAALTPPTLRRLQ